ncbi:MAG: anti-sigma factor family protein [Chloroflexia bacterium]
MTGRPSGTIKGHVSWSALLLEDLLSPRQRRRLQAHLSCCRSCRKRAQEVRAVRMLLAHAGRVPAPRPFTLVTKPPRNRKWLWYPFLRTATAGMAAFALVVFFTSLLMCGAVPPSTGCFRWSTNTPTEIMGALSGGTPRGTATSYASFERPLPPKEGAAIGPLLRLLQTVGLTTLGILMGLTFWAYRKERPFLM